MNVWKKVKKSSFYSSLPSLWEIFSLSLFWLISVTSILAGMIQTVWAQTSLFSFDERESSQTFFFSERKRKVTEDLLSSTVWERTAESLRKTYWDMENFVSDTRAGKTALFFTTNTIDNTILQSPKQIIIWYNTLTQQYEEIMSISETMIIQDIATTQDTVIITLVDRYNRLSVMKYTNEERHLVWEAGISLVWAGKSSIAFWHNEIITVLFDDISRGWISTLFFDATRQYLDNPGFLEGSFSLDLYADREWELFISYRDNWHAGWIMQIAPQSLKREHLSPFLTQNYRFTNIHYWADSVWNSLFLAYDNATDRWFIVIHDQSHRNLPTLDQHTTSQKNLSDLSGRWYPWDTVKIDIWLRPFEGQDLSDEVIAERTLTTTIKEQWKRTVQAPHTAQWMYEILLSADNQWVKRKWQRYAYYLLDRTKPVLSDGYDFGYNNKDNVLIYSFASTEYGKIDVYWTCADYFSNEESSLVQVSSLNGINEVWFRYLPDWVYNDCAVSVTDTAGNMSERMMVSEFSVRR